MNGSYGSPQGTQYFGAARRGDPVADRGARPAGQLYGFLNGAGRWLAWVALAGLAVAGLAIIVLITRLRAGARSSRC